MKKRKNLNSNLIISKEDIEFVVDNTKVSEVIAKKELIKHRGNIVSTIISIKINKEKNKSIKRGVN